MGWRRAEAVPPLRHKKNLKALYIVHPTSFLRVLWTVLQPLIR